VKADAALACTMDRLFIMAINNPTVNDGVAHSLLQFCVIVSVMIRLFAICRSNFILQQNFPYLVNFDLEHSMDADRPGDYYVQVW